MFSNHLPICCQIDVGSDLELDTVGRARWAEGLDDLLRTPGGIRCMCRVTCKRLDGTLNVDEAVQYVVTLKAGSTVDLTVTDETGQLDTIMGLYEETGTQLIAENDDIDETSLNSGFT